MTYETCRDVCESRPSEVVANIAMRLIHHTNCLLDQQIRSLEQTFVRKGDLRERMTRARLAAARQTIQRGLTGTSQTLI